MANMTNNKNHMMNCDICQKETVQVYDVYEDGSSKLMCKSCWKDFATTCKKCERYYSNDYFECPRCFSLQLTIFTTLNQLIYRIKERIRTDKLPTELAKRLDIMSKQMKDENWTLSTRLFILSGIVTDMDRAIERK